MILFNWSEKHSWKYYEEVGMKCWLEWEIQLSWVVGKKMILNQFLKLWVCFIISIFWHQSGRINSLYHSSSRQQLTMASINSRLIGIAAIGSFRIALKMEMNKWKVGSGKINFTSSGVRWNDWLNENWTIGKLKNGNAHIDFFQLPTLICRSIALNTDRIASDRHRTTLIKYFDLYFFIK